MAFRETQRFRHPVLLALVILPLLLSFLALVQQVIRGKPIGPDPAPDGLIVGLFLLMLGVALLFLWLRLDTRVDKHGVHYRFRPFHRSWRQVPWADLRYCWVRKYRPIREYGGWGYRIGLRGRALNVSGSWGLQLETRRGKRLLLGTRQPLPLTEELRVLGRWQAPPEAKAGEGQYGKGE